MSDTPARDGVNRRGQIKMTEDEQTAFLGDRRSMTLSTIGKDGLIHSTAMWYSYLDGVVRFETKSKSQKVANLRRDDRLTCLVEDGETYDTLRGVQLAGRGKVIEDRALLEEVGKDVISRYMAPYTEELRGVLDGMLHKRVVVELVAERTVSWDHRKLG